MTAITTPERVGGREQARSFAAGDLGFDPSSVEVAVDFTRSKVITPSFLDEMILVFIGERQVSKLRLIGLAERERRLAQRSAEVRGMSDRLVLES